MSAGGYPPGVTVDADGGMHVDCRVVVESYGLEPTEERQERVLRFLRTYFGVQEEEVEVERIWHPPHGMHCGLEGCSYPPQHAGGHSWERPPIEGDAGERETRDG